MLILGLLLVVLSAAAVVLLWAYNSSGGPEQMIALFGRDMVSVNVLEAFIAGIVLALVFSLGLWMVVVTGRRRRVARAEARSARQETRAVAAERDELAEQLAREREMTTTTAATLPSAEREVAPADSTEQTGAHRREGRRFRMPHRKSDAPAEQPR